MGRLAMMNAFHYKQIWRQNLLHVALFAALLLSTTAAGLPQIAKSQAGALPAAEFSRIIRDFSEEGGYFFSDNFTSNEDSYLTVLDKMRQLGATGGAYIGVGPEQNFTCIAKIRPRIAFIVDIRSTFAYYRHPANLPGYRLCTLLQSLPVFLRDFDAGRYQDYQDVIRTNYIAPDRPTKSRP
jgi:hypothetical protein